MKASSLPADLTLSHVRMLLLFIEESAAYEAENGGYVPWEHAMKLFERRYKALGFAAADDLITGKHSSSRFLLPPEGKARAEVFKPSPAILLEADALYSLREKLEKDSGAEVTPRPKKAGKRENVEV